MNLQYLLTEERVDAHILIIIFGHKTSIKPSKVFHDDSYTLNFNIQEQTWQVRRLVLKETPSNYGTMESASAFPPWRYKSTVKLL